MDRASECGGEPVNVEVSQRMMRMDEAVEHWSEVRNNHALYQGWRLVIRIGQEGHGRGIVEAA